MSNKCEWKDGKFEPCEESRLYVSFDIEPDRGLLLTMKNSVVIPSFCLFCGADIQKPELLIEKNDRELFLEAVIETYSNMMEKSNDFNKQLLADFKELRNK